MERLFKDIVNDNAGWLYRFIRSIVHSDYAADDLLQDTFYNAYKGFSGYSDTGKEGVWLKAIARNAVRRYYNNEKKYNFISTDSEGCFMADLKSPLPEAADILVKKELIADIMRLIASLPVQQRSIVYYRYVDGLSVSETAAVTGLPEGTVKSNAHYGVQKIRSQLGISNKKIITRREGKIMKCEEVYGLLFEYVKGYLTAEERANIAAHVKDCPECGRIAKILTAMWGYIQKEFTDDDSYFGVTIQLKNERSLAYVGFSSMFTQSTVDEYNAILAANNNLIPENRTFMGCGHDADIDHLSEFGNDGERVEFETYPSDMFANHVRVRHISMVKFHKWQWIYSVFMRKGENIQQSKEAPNLYKGYFCNNLGREAKCGLFAPVYDGADNIRISRGNGVLEFDGIKIPYSQRYTGEGEKIDLQFTFNM